MTRQQAINVLRWYAACMPEIDAPCDVCPAFDRDKRSCGRLPREFANSKVIEALEVLSKTEEKPALVYEVRYGFYEPPNFSMVGSPEEVVIARCNTREAAEACAKTYVLAAINSLRGDLPPIKCLEDLNDSDEPWGYTCRCGDRFVTAFYGEEVANYCKIVHVCPECGCVPEDPPYCMDGGHCPMCGLTFN